jgi:hypothetical protein
MVYNPQLLIPKTDASVIQHSQADLDAIYVPFKNPCPHLDGLLHSLRSCEVPVYLLPSDHDFFGENVSALKNAHVLNVDDSDCLRFFRNLLTSRHKHVLHYCSEWDLPIKRSFALTDAIGRHYQKILFVDADIRISGENTLAIGSSCLENYSIAGCFVDNFIDTSVVGHLEREVGEDVYSFVSGSFVFIRPSETRGGFFPCIYNEDWLFMLPHVLAGSICSFGSIKQVAFDPFKDTKTAAFQEFGEVIAEGLYSLVISNEYARRFEFQMWRDAVAERRELLVWLNDSLAKPQHREIVSVALAVNEDISPEDCQQFVSDWEDDKVSWARYIDDLM